MLRSEALAVCSSCQPLQPILAQDAVEDVEIINRDGERIDAEVIVVQQDEQDRGGIMVQNQDGKITIVDADGNQREIDVSGAQSIIVNQAVKSIMKDGEKQTETFGKAIIIGPDGVRQEVELGGNIEGQLGNAMPGRMRLKWEQSNKFMIGVNCSPMTETLKSQLGLETGAGLVVEELVDGSPAANAGLQRHDILMFADDTQLATTSDLVEAVQQAGQENSKISLTIIRKGKEIGIDVTPVERPAGDQMVLPEGMAGNFAFIPELEGNIPFDFEFKQMGPGVILGPDFNRDDFHKRMQEQMEAMRRNRTDAKTHARTNEETGLTILRLTYRKFHNDK